MRDALASPRNLQRHEGGSQIPVITVKVSTLNKIITQARPLVLDASDVLDDHQRKALGDLGCAALSIGRGQGV